MDNNDIECQLKINNKDIQIKFLTNLLSQNKIKIPLTLPKDHENKSIDDIMRDTCSLYNKINRNSKMVYIEENSATNICIEDDDDEDDDDEPPRAVITQAKKISNVDINKDMFNDLFETIKTQRTHKKILSEYNKLKMATLRQIDPSSYVDIIISHYDVLCGICKGKNYTTKRTDEVLSMAFCPLDIRLLLTKGHLPKTMTHLVATIGNTFIDSDDVNYLKQSLGTTIYYGNNKESLVSNFLNYGTAVMTLKQNMDVYFVNQKQMAYLPDDDGEDFRFYFLSRETKTKRFWEMDCRLDEFITVFVKNISTYLIDLFRKIYFEVFHDYVYRSDFAKSAIIFENDGEQLLSNLCTLATYKEISRLLKTEIKKYCAVKETDNDVFVLKSDDAFLKAELDKRESEVDHEMIMMLFEGMTQDTAMSLYSYYMRK